MNLPVAPVIWFDGCRVVLPGNENIRPGVCHDAH